MKFKLPVILEDYYDEIEENVETVSKAQMLSDCNYIITELGIGEWYGDYSKKEIAALKRFRTRLWKILK